MLVWALTRTEVLSALCRLAREAALDEQGFRRAFSRLERHAARWTEVELLAQVRQEAERLLRAHALRTGDAMQLGAAALVADGHPRALEFVVLDQRLAAAAGNEGFRVIVPGG